MSNAATNSNQTAAPVVQGVVMAGYRLSRDYHALFRLISQGMIIAAFVDYRFYCEDMPATRDICKVGYRGPWQTRIFARGIGYGGLEPWYADRGEDELTCFSKHCTAMNLEWIKP